MKFQRRQFLHLAASAAVLPAASRLARAQTYPARPVRLIVGAPAGGTSDILARLIGQWLADRLGQQFVVENRPGAGGNLAIETVVHAPADGYMLLLVAPNSAISPALYDNLGYDFIRDIAPVAGLIRVPNVMEVNLSVPAKSVPEFIAYAKANPGKLNMASPGIGTSVHLAGELFKMMAGVSMQHVPYRGDAPALTDLLGGRVQVMFGVVTGSIEQIKAGKMRALAVTTATRAEALPDVPTVAEFVPGYESAAWFGVGAPRGTPAEAVALINAQINAGLADPKLKARLAELGGSALVGSPADFGKLVGDETQKWARVVKFANIKLD